MKEIGLFSSQFWGMESKTGWAHLLASGYGFSLVHYNMVEKRAEKVTWRRDQVHRVALLYNNPLFRELTPRTRSDRSALIHSECSVSVILSPLSKPYILRVLPPQGHHMETKFPTQRSLGNTPKLYSNQTTATLFQIHGLCSIPCEPGK